jgi:hypothetical protein
VTCNWSIYSPGEESAGHKQDGAESAVGAVQMGGGGMLSLECYSSDECMNERCDVSERGAIA